MYVHRRCTQYRLACSARNAGGWCFREERIHAHA